MGARPICPGLREGTGCHNNQRAEAEQPDTKRPKLRMRIAPRRPQDPRDAPPLVTSRSACTPAAPPTRHRGGEAKGREGALFARAASLAPPQAVTVAPPPQLSNRLSVPPRPLPASVVEAQRPLCPAQSSFCRLLPLCQSCFLAFFPPQKFSLPPLPFSPASHGLFAFKTQSICQKVCPVRIGLSKGGWWGLKEKTWKA